ncbi:nuclear transport factor 2 family protein [Pseudomonas sp.]|uniref:nuclear transport factor 2 family protein n=1 Tax=Pseudomonas sp. TaxID=306 RepID=UPI0026253DCD|nr:nuclear transport factor 2 family protein [Pseudomonas sp.]
MTLALPPAIARYFAADAAKSGDFSECFTADAVVRDEGRTYVGLPAIQAWKAGSDDKYSYTSEPFACEELPSASSACWSSRHAALNRVCQTAALSLGGKTLVTSHLVGNFPGSPLDLRYGFSLEGDRIAALEIGV